MKRNILLIILFFIFSHKVLSTDIIIIASINNKSITNYDLFLEQKANNILEGNDKEYNKKYYLQKKINDQIKLLELEEISNISYNLAVRQANEFLKKSKLEITEEIKKYIIDKIALQIEWDRYITKNFIKKLEVNLSEINYISKSKNLSENETKKLIDLEKRKKLNLISTTRFNEIKKKYLITFYK
jgi:hypothetical protein